MIQATIRLLEFMDGTPVAGADVDALIVVKAWFVRPANRPEVVGDPPDPGDEVRGGPSDLSTLTVREPGGSDKPQTISLPGISVRPRPERGTSGPDGIITFLFDAEDAFERQRTLLDQRVDAVAGNVAAVLSVHVSCAGLDQTLTFSRSDDFLSVNSRITKDITLDFVKVIVGHTTPDSATLWFCHHGTVRPSDRYVCEIDEIPNQPGEVTVSPVALEPVVFVPDQANTAVLKFEELNPATAYAFRLHSREVENDLGAGRIVTHGEFTTAPSADSGNLRLVFSSCHQPTTEDSLGRWQALTGRRDYDLMLLTGDQIYEDGIRGGSSEQEWFEGYVERYHQYWDNRPMREVLRRTPTYMALDDHEITGDWGTLVKPTDDPQDPLKKRFNGAIRAYRIFQHTHNPGGQDPVSPLYYHFRWGPAAFFVMDSRTMRGREAPDPADPFSYLNFDPDETFPILGERQYNALREWATNNPEAQEADVVFFVSPVRLAFIPTDQIREAGRKTLATVGFLLAGVTGAYIGYKSLPYLERYYVEGEKSVDLPDQWTTDLNQLDLRRVLDVLFEVANDTQDDGQPGPHPRAVFVLSGDSHLGMMHTIVSRKRDERGRRVHEKNPTIFQITSSPISHAAWLEEYFDDVLEAIPAPQPILGKALLEAIRLSGESIDRFTLDRPGPGNYRTQLHGMRANRNFGRVGIERVRVDRRAYQFHLSIHGQPDGLAWDIEIDLDNEFVIPTGVAPYPAVANIRDHRL